MGTFYCGNCGEHKKDHLVARLTEGGKKVCKSCEEKRMKRESDRKKVLFVGNSGALLTGEAHEKSSKRKMAKRYKEGKLPPWCYS